MTQDLKTQILSGANTLCKIHGEYEEQASNTEIATSAAELLRTENGNTLAGYAGIASAVSTFGGGAAATAIASAAGLTAASGASLTGATTTTALVAAVGGPSIAAVAVVGAVTATGYGVYKAAHWLGGWLFD
jgi:hypothetical protein